jgi:hypothetical protein
MPKAGEQSGAFSFTDLSIAIGVELIGNSLVLGKAFGLFGLWRFMDL